MDFHHLPSSFIVFLFQVMMQIYSLIVAHTFYSLLVFAALFEKLSFLVVAGFVVDSRFEFKRCSAGMLFGFVGLANSECSCYEAFGCRFLSTSHWNSDLSHFSKAVTVGVSYLYSLILVKQHLERNCFLFFCLTARLLLFDSFDDLHSGLATDSWFLCCLEFCSMLSLVFVYFGDYFTFDKFGEHQRF